MPPGFDEAQRQYDAMEPPEPFCDEYEPDEEGVCENCGCDEREHPLEEEVD